MKKYFLFFNLFFLTVVLNAQVKTEQERLLEALKQSGYIRQEGNHLIFKVKKASDTPQIKMMYGSLFASDKWTIGFDVDGKYFASKKGSFVKKSPETAKKEEIKEAIITTSPGTLPLAPATAEQLYLTGGTFLIRTARDYRYLTAASATEAVRPVLKGYSENQNSNFWDFILQPGGYYKIKLKNGLFLEAANNPGTNPNAVRIFGSSRPNPDLQLWKIDAVENGLYKIVSKNGQYLSAFDDTIRNGSLVNVSTSPGNIFNSQYWHLIRMNNEVSVMTSFNPATDGFYFANRFNNTRFIADVEWTFGGRCAGMAYAALDYYFNSIPIPSQSELPLEGSVLSTYIGERQENSTVSNLDRIIELNLNVGGSRTMEYFNWGLQSFGGGRLQQIRTELDAGRPVPIILFNPKGNLIDYPHHSVVVIGYSLGRYTGDLRNYKGDLKLYVYDPNFPRKTMILIPNLADINNPRYAHVNADINNGKVTEWLTYFPNAGFRPRIPLTNSSITGCPSTILRLTGQNFRGTNHNNENFKCAIANRADFYGAGFVQVDFENAILDSANFHGANVRNSNFSKTSLIGANFTGADLKDTRFILAKANRTKFEGADMKLAWLQNSEMTASNFIRADLHRAQLAGGNFTGTHFTWASLSHSNCYGANFSTAELSLTNFNNANLQFANFRNAIFENNDFRGADLRGADFTGALIRGRLVFDTNTKFEGVIGLAGH